ncbi:MAG: response regulator [Nitrospira sp.]|nr:response regulator [Nitrospira sp.]
MPPERAKPTILIVEDEEGPRNALKIILRPFYSLVIASNRHEAFQALLSQPIDLVTLDLKLPDGYGLDLFHAIQRAHRGVEIVIITGYGTLKSSQEAMQHGAAGYLLKPFNVADLITLINRTLERKRYLDGIRTFLLSSSSLWADEQSAAAAWAELRNRFHSLTSFRTMSSSRAPGDEMTLALVADVLEASDRLLLVHTNRVRSYAALLAAALNLSQTDQRALMIGSLLHDLGYVALDRGAGSRLDPASEADRVETQHPLLGVRMAAPLGVPTATLLAIAHHHERYDGSGFPEGLAGDRIPLLARIVGVAQTFDRLMTSNGHTAGAYSDACARLSALAGTALAPDLVALFLERIGELQQTGQASRPV